MKKYLVRTMLVMMFAALVAATGGGPVREASAMPKPQTVPVNAFYLMNVPQEYVKLEKLLPVLKSNGADTIMVELWTGGARMDNDALANLTYLAHQSGLKIFVIVQTRENKTLLAEHPEWEDMQYDLGSGTIQPTGRLDLFQQPVVEHIKDVIKDIASYSVDGILLGSDFYYGDVEGMSVVAQEAYKQKLNASVIGGSMYKTVKENGNGYKVEEYGEGFMAWAGIKRDRLTEILREVMKTALQVNPGVKFGLPLHVDGFTTPVEALTRYSYDMTAFRKIDVDYYWIAIPHRELRAKQGLNYKMSMELISRSAKIAMTMAKDPVRTIVAIQTTASSGRILPLSEIEEASLLVKKYGEPGIAYMINPDSQPPAALTKKMFRRQS